MTTDEAKALFALMGWEWKPYPLGVGNGKHRGKMPDEPWQSHYELFVNETMVAATKDWREKDKLYSEYERYDPDRCLTEYARVYLCYLADEKP